MISPTLDVYDPIIKKWPFIRDEGKRTTYERTLFGM